MMTFILLKMEKRLTLKKMDEATSEEISQEAIDNANNAIQKVDEVHNVEKNSKGSCCY